jgi:hypothetical protein
VPCGTHVAKYRIHAQAYMRGSRRRGAEEEASGEEAILVHEPVGPLAAAVAEHERPLGADGQLAPRRHDEFLLPRRKVRGNQSSMARVLWGRNRETEERKQWVPGRTRSHGWREAREVGGDEAPERLAAEVVQQELLVGGAEAEAPRGLHRPPAAAAASPPPPGARSEEDEGAVKDLILSKVS